MVKKYARYIAKNYPAVRKRYKVYYPAVKQLGKDIMYLKGLINSELKYHYVQDNNNVDYNGTIISLCDVPVGDDAIDRDGERIMPRYLSLNLRLQSDIVSSLGAGPSTSAGHIAVRVIVFRYWGLAADAIGTNPAVNDILLPGLVGTQNVVDAQLAATITGSKGDRNRRIEVLRNYQFVLDRYGKSSHCINENIEMNGGNKKEHMEFYNSTTAPPTSGGIFVLIASGDSTSTNLGYHLATKLSFYDN